jgi:hypothetical protein
MLRDPEGGRETIDEMVDEKREERDRIYDRFQVNGRCRCPLCKSLERSNTNGEIKTGVHERSS